MPKILLLDIETAPLEVYAWKLGETIINLDMVKQNTTMLCYAAKWLSEPEIFFDKVKLNSIRDDYKISKSLKNLVDQADIIIGHNIKRFDRKKSNYRILVNQLEPTNSFVKVIDTLTIAKKYFAFDSNKLEHLAQILNLKYKKLKHEKFSGMALWTECLKGNRQAWQEMEHYNKYDVLVLEECYKKLIPWDNSINFNVFYEDNENRCSCGSFVVKKQGMAYTKTGKYQRYKCDSCGKKFQDKTNLLTNIKRKDMLK